MAKKIEREFVKPMIAQIPGEAVLHFPNAKDDSMLVPEEVMGKSLEEYCEFMKKAEGKP